MSVPNVFLAYLSPETVLPMTSIVAAIAGGSMLITGRFIRLLGRCFRGKLRHSHRTAGASEPRVQSPDGVTEP